MTSSNQTVRLKENLKRLIPKQNQDFKVDKKTKGTKLEPRGDVLKRFGREGGNTIEGRRAEGNAFDVWQ
jgi:hypothetical protein